MRVRVRVRFGIGFGIGFGRGSVSVAGSGSVACCFSRCARISPISPLHLPYPGAHLLLLLEVREDLALDEI